MANIYLGGAPQDYGAETFAYPTGIDAYSNIMERQAMMAPLAQYRAMLSQANQAAPLGRYQQQAAMQGFSPAYSMYEAFGVPGTGASAYGSFTDYLAGAAQGGAQTREDVLARMNLIASAGAVGADPSDLLGEALAGQYYGGDVEEAASRRLATTEALSRFGGAGANPQMQRAMQGLIDRLYGNYLGSTDYTADQPGGFMDYYLSQRGLRTPAA